jgi:hypothetical protein
MAMKSSTAAKLSASDFVTPDWKRIRDFIVETVKEGALAVLVSTVVYAGAGRDERGGGGHKRSGRPSCPSRARRSRAPCRARAPFNGVQATSSRPEESWPTWDRTVPGGLALAHLRVDRRRPKYQGCRSGGNNPYSRCTGHPGPRTGNRRLRTPSSSSCSRESTPTARSALRNRRTALRTDRRGIAPSSIRSHNSTPIPQLDTAQERRLRPREGTVSPFRSVPHPQAKRRPARWSRSPFRSSR